MKLHLVWNPGMTECVGFLEEADAEWTATGGPQWETPSVGEAFRECYGDDADVLPQTVVDIEEIKPCCCDPILIRYRKPRKKAKPVREATSRGDGGTVD